ncbi:MAG: ComEC/Rec2 family competence protein, partial [Bacteroidales bacterium]
NPLFILDLGFQLSFLAVLSILLMQSFSANLFIHKHKSIRIICSYLLICISAQIMTAPLVSYYFGLFPSNFLIANIISLPFIYILFGGSIFALLLRSFHLPYFWLGGTIEKLNNWFEDILKYLRELPHATFDYTLNTKELIGIYIIYFAVLLFIRNHRKFAICTLSMFIVFIVFYEFNQTQTLHLIPVKNQASIILQTDKKLVCFHQDTLTSESKRLLKRDLNATQIHQRTSESLLEINGNKILRLDTDTLRKRITTQPRQVELLILSQGCKDSLSHILTLFTPKHIILDADLSNYWRNLWKNEASQLNCEVYDLNEIGYFTQQL